MNLLVTVPDDMVSALFTQGLEHIIGKCSIQVYEGSVPLVDTKPKPVVIDKVERHEGKQIVYARPHGDKTNKKLIKYRCPDCGAYNYKLCEKGLDGSYFIPCRECGNQHTFRDADLLKLEYTCEDCGASFYYYTPVGDYTIEYDKCRECGSKKDVTAG